VKGVESGEWRVESGEWRNTINNKSNNNRIFKILSIIKRKTREFSKFTQ
jgi:hypothetical protein